MTSRKWRGSTGKPESAKVGICARMEYLFPVIKLCSALQDWARKTGKEQIQPGNSFQTGKFSIGASITFSVDYPHEKQ